MNNLEDIEFAENADPRCVCILLLDTSASMGGAPLAALNEGLQALQDDLKADDIARRRVEIEIITFGKGGVQTQQEFVTADQFQAPTLSVGGTTPMGKAVIQAIDSLRARKEQYRTNGIAYYRPWIFLITDGAPTDSWQDAAQRIKVEEKNKALAFFAVGVGDADMRTLAQISVRKPLQLRGLKFRELFLWLSSSQKRVSASKIGEKTELASPAGWAEVD